jgi:hypothetical protein
MKLFSHRARALAQLQRALLLCWMVAVLGELPAPAAELKPETVAAFDQYVRVAEAQMKEDAQDGRFLIVDRLPEAARQRAYEHLQEGEIYIAEIRIREDDRSIHIPSGRVHHWAAAIFIPGATLPETLAVLEDYNQHQDIYKPDVRRSRLLEQHGNESKIYLQLFNKSRITAVLNANFDVTDTQFGSTQYEIVSRSTRIAEVADPDQPDEHELPVGHDDGFMWRLNSYWRVEAKDGGVYVQNESIALSRGVPPILAWFVNPLIKSIPRNVLFHLLTDTREAVLSSAWRQESLATGRFP